MSVESMLYFLSSIIKTTYVAGTAISNHIPPAWYREGMFNLMDRKLGLMDMDPGLMDLTLSALQVWLQTRPRAFILLSVFYTALSHSVLRHFLQQIMKAEVVPSQKGIERHVVQLDFL